MKGLGHGQVWWADLDEVRPVVVLTRGTAEGLADGSAISLDNVQLLPVDHLLRRAGDISARWDEVCDALAHAVGCHLV